MGIWDIMRISLTGMQTQQTAMEVVSHNVANVSTPGYSREEAVINPLTPRQQSGLFLGTGATVSTIRDTEDRFLNYSIFATGQQLGNQDVANKGLSQMEQVFNETGGAQGLSSAMDTFWNSWEDLASTPENAASRYTLRGNAQVMVNQFHSLSSRLNDLAKDANNGVKGATEQINGIVDQIKTLNGKISAIEAQGQTATDYRSERNNLMEQLSTQIDYTYFEDKNGMVTISLAGGTPLLEGTTSGSLQAQENASNNGYYDVMYVSSTGAKTDITDQIKGGGIYGQLQMRDQYTGQYRSQLDELAYNMVNQVNSLHTTGYGLNGSTNNNFFSPLASATGAAASISLDSAVQSDVNNIAAASTDNPGDNTLANQIASLRDALTMNSGQSTFQDYYGSMVSDIGIESQNADSEYQRTSLVMQSPSGCQRPPYTEPPGSGILSHPGAPNLSQRGHP